MKIHSETDYEFALDRIYEIMEFGDFDDELEQELDVLTNLVEVYEEANFPLDDFNV